MLADTTRALQLLIQTIAEVDTLEESARVETIAEELYERDDAVLRELMQAIEARAIAIREQRRREENHRAANDKKGYESIAPLSFAARRALETRT